jgi:hypothetical protein
MITAMYDVKYDPDKDEEKSKCGSAGCGKKAKYRVVFDYLFDTNHQAICATWVYLCAEHYKPLIKTLRKANKEFEACDLESGKEKVVFT